VGQIFSWAE